jgi:hypothetical protein
MVTACMSKTEDDEILRTVALELMYKNPQKWQSPEGPTASEISKRHNIKLDIVKKKLNLLTQLGLVRSLAINPKRWVFNEYNFDRMDTDDPVYLLLVRYDEDDYIKFSF